MCEYLAKCIEKRDSVRIYDVSVSAKNRVNSQKKELEFECFERDDLSNALLPSDNDTYQALKTTGDGNCLYNSVSLLLRGDSLLANDLRALVACELFSNASIYAQHKHILSASSHPSILTNHEDTLFSMLLTPQVAKSFDNSRDRMEALYLEALNTCTDKSWSAMIHVLAISSALGKTVTCVYPEVNEAIRPLFNAKIDPVSCSPVSDGQELTIMWTRDGDLSSAFGSFFEPNHFVALVHGGSSDDKEQIHKRTRLPSKRHSSPYHSAQRETGESIPKQAKGQSKIYGFLENPSVSREKNDDTVFDMLSKRQSTDAAHNKDKQLDDSTLVHTDLDIGTIVSGDVSVDSLSNETKAQYLKKHFVPSTSYKFPGETVIKGKDKKSKTLTFQHSWLSEFEWLVYSPSEEGGYCKYCTLFPPQDERVSKTGVLVSKPLNRYSKVKGKEGILVKHAQTRYHQNALDAATILLSVLNTPQQSIVYAISKANQEQYEKNRHILECIIKALLVCGKQNISIRGHRDDSMTTASNKGNFLAILDLMSESDIILRNHLVYCKKNAMYTSKTIQNEIIGILGKWIRTSITKSLKRQDAVFAIIADEVTDKTANQEILSVCLRFVDQGEAMKPEIKEVFFDFVHLIRTTGASIASALLDSLKNNGLNARNIRGQAYDGAAAMSSAKVGVQARVKSVQPLALYTHCSSHVLNLSVASSCQNSAIRNMMGTISEVFIFFDSSPKRQRFFETVLNKFGPEIRVKKVKGLCKTRWIERHTCFETFFELYEYVCISFESIADPSSHAELVSDGNDESENEPGESKSWQWDKKTITIAQGLLNTLKSGSHLISFIIAKHVLELIKPLAVKLQRRDQDIVQAYAMIDMTKANVTEMRKKIEPEFSEMFSNAQLLADRVGGSIAVPRLAGRQQHRENILGADAEEYYRRNIAIPFVDNLSEQLNTRFSSEDRVTAALFELLPYNIMKKGDELDNLVSRLLFWEEDIETPSSLKSEIKAWQRYWTKKSQDNKNMPSDMINSLACADVDVFPNIHKLFTIGCTLPIGSVEAERSFSALRRIKTYLRSTMTEERLAGLALMHIHHNIKVEVSDIAELFIAKHPRRLFTASAFQ